MLPDSTDILVLGAGTAGSAAAAACARAGRQVHVVDAKPLDQAGARWRNGLPAAELAALGLEPPDPPAAHARGAFHMVAGWGPERLTIDDHEVLDLDMRWLVTQLQQQASEAGASLHGGLRVSAVEEADDHVGVRIGDRRIRANLVVDAAGMTGPSVPAVCPRRFICSAAQEDRELADPMGAKRFVVEHEVQPGDTLSFAGVAGGFSIVNATVTLPQGDHPGGVSLLTGSIPARGNPAGMVLLDRFVANNPWVGPRIFGGARPIPLVAPDPVVGLGRIARVGDAARQVFAIHGSGIAQGLRAARLLGQVLATDGSAWDYSVAYHRQLGPALAASAGFAAFSARLDVARVRTLIKAGLLHPHLVREGLHQSQPGVPLRIAPALAAAALKAPRAASRLLPIVPTLRRLEALQRRYPHEPELVPAWAAKRAALLEKARGAPMA